MDRQPFNRVFFGRIQCVRQFICGYACRLEFVYCRKAHLYKAVFPCGIAVKLKIAAQPSDSTAHYGCLCRGISVCFLRAVLFQYAFGQRHKAHYLYVRSLFIGFLGNTSFAFKNKLIRNKKYPAFAVVLKKLIECGCLAASGRTCDDMCHTFYFPP